METKPKVSVLVTTYNHERFIEKAILSVLNQNTSFTFQILVGEDCSADNTREKLISLHEKYPDKITMKLRDENLGRQNFIDLFYSCTGEYIAMLDGDDYWIDKNKLQKQIDQLDNDPKLTMSFTASKLLYEDSDEKSAVIYRPPERKHRYTIADILRDNFMTTSTVVLRNNVLDKLPDWFEELPIGDWPLWTIFSQRGPAGYIDKATSVYRQHKKSVYSSLTKIKRLKISLKTRELMIPHLNDEHREICYHSIYLYNKKLMLSYRKLADTEEVKKYAHKSEKLLKYYQNDSLREIMFIKYFKHYNSAFDKVFKPILRVLYHPKLLMKKIKGE